jgi:CubicO group peptidase (beta-lactamase class C family)
MNRLFAIILSCFLSQIIFSQSVEEKIEKLLEDYTKAGVFNGSALVSENGIILLGKGYGFKSLRDSSFNDSNTIFQIASVTKQFTSTLILKLAELDKLNLDDKLSQYFPDFPDGDKITLENLLNHTSGIYDWTLNTINFLPTGEKSLLDYLKTKGLAFEPGTNYNYSNSNYSLLGYIIQKATGLTYEDAIRKYIFEPLNMTQSGFDFKNLTSKDKATGYSSFTKKSKTEGVIYDSTGPFAAGEIYSTTGDLYKWHEGLESYKIISQASLEKAYTPLMNKYGYGWEIDNFYGRRVASHSGSISGFCSNLARITEDDVVIILLNNKEGSDLGMITNEILSILYGQPYATHGKKYSSDEF